MPPQRSRPCGEASALVVTERRYCLAGDYDTRANPSSQSVLQPGRLKAASRGKPLASVAASRHVVVGGRGADNVLRSARLEDVWVASAFGTGWWCCWWSCCCLAAARSAA